MAESTATINIDITKPEWLKEMSILKLEEGDVIIISSDFTLTQDERERSNNMLAKMFPRNDVLTLEAGSKIGVLRKESR